MKTVEYYPPLNPIDWNISAPVICPVCSDNYCHIANVVVNQNGLITTVDADSERLDPDGPPSGRGSQVEINFWCEHGHSFTIAFRFHKGETDTATIRRADTEQRVEGEGYVSPPGELWRD